MNSKINIRLAAKGDIPFIHSMIVELAEYEKAKEEVHLTVEELEKDGFGDDPLYKSIILELEEVRVGMALFYNRYSTWKGRSLYLEDLYVIPEARGNKLGLEAMKWLSRYAVETNCKRFEWQVLDWNTPSIDFYKSLNTTLDSEWINCRLEGEAIRIK